MSQETGRWIMGIAISVAIASISAYVSLAKDVAAHNEAIPTIKESLTDMNRKLDTLLLSSNKSVNTARSTQTTTP